MRRMRPSSVLPGAAVNPNRALVSTTIPVEAAAFFFAFSFTRGCHRVRTSSASRAASRVRGVLI